MLRFNHLYYVSTCHKVRREATLREITSRQCDAVREVTAHLFNTKDCEYSETARLSSSCLKLFILLIM